MWTNGRFVCDLFVVYMLEHVKVAFVPFLCFSDRLVLFLKFFVNVCPFMFLYEPINCGVYIWYVFGYNMQLVTQLDLTSVENGINP